jgi:hypothetical protein
MATITVVDAFLRGLELLKFVREIGANAGPGVEAIQKSTGNKPPDAWCASLMYYVGRLMLGSRWILPRTASCDELLAWARKEGLLIEGAGATPMRGDLCLVMRSATDAIHVCAVTQVHEDARGFDTREGNTNPGGGRDGYGVFDRKRGHPEDPAIKAGLYYTFVRWHLSVH